MQVSARRRNRRSGSNENPSAASSTTKSNHINNRGDRSENRGHTSGHHGGDRYQGGFCRCQPGGEEPSRWFAKCGQADDVDATSTKNEKTHPAKETVIGAGQQYSKEMLLTATKADFSKTTDKKTPESQALLAAAARTTTAASSTYACRHQERD